MICGILALKQGFNVQDDKSDHLLSGQPIQVDLLDAVTGQRGKGD
jgi:hypothetical protein